MGKLYKPKGSDYWYLDYRYKGKRIRESSKTKKKVVAEQMLKIREGEIAEGRLPSITFEKVTFRELASDMLTDYKINAKRSIDRVEQAIKKHLFPFFGSLKAPDITTAKVKQYVEIRLASGARNATINRELAFLKRMLNLGARQTPPKINRVPYIPMLSENNTRKGFFEADEFTAIMEHLPDYLKPIVLFAYRTGWRRGEILNLTWNRVDRKNGIVRLEAGETKNSDARTVYLDPELKAVVSQLFANRVIGDPHVFLRNGEPIKAMKEAWASACSKAGIPGRLFHDLRRTAIRNMVRAGIPERVAMMISGHKTRSVFDRYNIVSDDDLRRAATQQSEYLAKSS